MNKLSDRELIQIVGAALSEAARRSGGWIACRPGCYQCCYAPFEISQLDARRLRDGLAELHRTDPERAARVRERARASASRLGNGFPSDEAEFAKFAYAFDGEPCPALDPDAGTCDLYAARPMTCRIFGPAVRGSSGAIGVCELCYSGASDAEIGACAVEIESEEFEAALNEEIERESGTAGTTLVALCLAS
jgi:Fe-S-cluster containining protein